MSAKKCVAVVLFVLISVNPLAAEEAQLKDRSFENCLLHEVEGRIWLQQQIVALGMVGVVVTPPFCLSEELAEQFAPLVSRIVPENEQWPKSFHSFEMPNLREQKGHFVLVSMKAQMGGIFTRRPEEVDRTREVYRPSHYEIVKVRMVGAEFVGREWIEGWRTLDEALKEIVSESLAAPGEEKRKRLAEAIEKGSRALNAMAEMKVNDDFQVLLDKVDPNARVVETFKGGIAQQWQEWLERFAGRLKIEPKTPLPPRCSRGQVLELLLESKSAAEFKSKIRQSCPVDGLERELLWSSKLGRIIYSWEVEGFDEGRFAELRDRAKEMLAEIRKDEKERAKGETSEEMEQWGVVLRPAGDKLLAEKLILRGAVVEKVLNEQPQVGLRAGDIVVDYGGIYDVVMGWHRFGYRMGELRWGGELQVLRGDQIITISVKGKL